MKGWWLLVAAVLMYAMTDLAWGAGKATFAGGSLGMSKPLEVKGQNRSLAMLQATKAGKTKIGFVQPRKNFRPQILSTTY
jgi:hypothetical protein